MNIILEYIQTVQAANGIQKILLDMLFKGTIILLTAGIACLLLRKATAAIRSMVWSLAMISLLLLPVLSGILPHWQARILPAEKIETPIYENSSITDHTVTIAVKSSDKIEAEPVPGNVGSIAKRYYSADADRPPISTGARTGNQSFLERVQPGLSSIPIQAWLCIIWGTGVVCVLFPALSGLIWIAFYSRRGTRVVNGRMADIMQRTIKKLRIKRRIQLLQWNGRRKLTMPTTWGMIRPVIIMPREADSWPEARIQVAIMHELAHIQRMDWLAQILARLACAVYWFNPLVWFACRSMRMECERSCDDAVLQAGHTGTDYAEHLLDIVKSMCVKRHTAMVTIPMGRVSTVEGRIRAILDGTRKRWSLTRWAVLGAAVVAFSVLIPFAALQATARTIRTEHKTVTVTDEGTNTTVVVSNIVISTTITAVETPGITNKVVEIEEEVIVTQAAETHSLSFTTSGRITKIKPPGTVVTNGEILAQLDSGNIWLSVEAARIGVIHTDEVFSRAKEKYTAFKNMFKEDLITAEEMNEAEEEYLIAKADLSKAQIALSKAESDLEACFLRAPADGTIEKAYKQPGTIIQPAAPVLQFSNRLTKGVQITKEHDQHSAAGVKTVTKHIERSPVVAQPVLSNFVRLVVGPETMTFEGKDIAWEALPEALKKITGRQNTVIEFAQPDNANPDMIAFGKLINLAQNFNFNHVSDIGEKPLGTKGTVRCTGTYETGRIIPLTLAAGTAKTEGIVTAQSVTFTAGESGPAKAVIDYSLLSGPKSRWWITLSLLDGEGKEVASERISTENSGIIAGIPSTEQKKAIFYFGDPEKNSRIARFRISISQGFLLPKQVMIAAQLIVRSGEEEKVISQPTLVGRTGKEAEIFIGAQEPVPGKLVDTGIKVKILPSIQNGVLVVSGKAIFAELTGISSNSINKLAPLKWHSVKENTTEFDVRVTDQSKQYSIGPIPYKENETLIIKLNAKVINATKKPGNAEAESGHTVQTSITTITKPKEKRIIKTVLKKALGVGETVEGSGTVTTETRELSLCRGIQNSIGVDIHVRKNEEASLSITGDDNLLPLIQTAVKNKILVISADKSFSTQNGITIDVFLPAVEVVEIAGSGDSKIEGLNERKLRIKQMGSGNISGSGTIDFLGIDNQGSGSVNFKDVRSSDCGIRLSGSGNVTVTVTNSLYAEITSSGNIEYFGNPTVITSDVTGSGTIKGKSAEVISRGRQSRVKIRKR